MSTSQRPDRHPADVWEDLVRQGVPKDEATRRVREMMGAGEAPDRPRRAGQGLLNFGNEALQGASFGLADEAVGLVSPSARDAMRERSRTFNADHPKLAMGAQLAGGFATGGAAAKGLGMVAKRALPAVLARAVTSLPGEAGILSGTAAAGAAEGNRGTAFGIGAAGGAIAGPLIAGAVSRAAGSKLGQRAGNLAARAMAKMRGGPQPSAIAPVEPVALRAVQRALGRAGKSTDDVTSALQAPTARRAELALMDEVPALTEAIATLPGEGAERMGKALQARARGRTGRELGAMDDVLGVAGQSPMPNKAAIKTARKVASDPLYEQARSFAPTADPRVQALLDADDVKKALDAGARRVRSRNAVARARGEPELELPKEGYAVAQLDYAKRHLDDLIRGAKKSGEASRVDELTQLKDALVGVIDDATRDPNGGSIYAAARAAYAEPSRQIDALSLGQKALQMRDDELRAAVTALAPAERAQFRVGLADAARRRPNWAREIVSDKPGAGVKESTLAAAFDDATEFQTFKDALAAEAQGGSTKYVALGSSRTPQRAAAHEDLQTNLAADGVALLRGGVPGFLTTKADALAKRAQSAMLAGQRDRIAKTLMLRPGMPGYDDLLQALTRQQRLPATGRRVARAALPATGSSGKRIR